MSDEPIDVEGVTLWEGEARRLSAKQVTTLTFAIRMLIGERDEAVKALRELHEAHDIDERDLDPHKRAAIIDDATERARAVLAKHPKPPVQS